MTTQEQFLDVVDRDTAEQRFHAALDLRPLAEETVALDAALGRVLAGDIVAPVDVPAFDRSNYDGFAVRAEDTTGAREEAPRRLKLAQEIIAAGVAPQVIVTPGLAVPIATGGMLPRGAEAIVMVEYTDLCDGELEVAKAVVPGFGVAFAGTDICAGETVLRAGVRLSSRETGVLAALGIDRVAVYRRPKVAIISTGDEIIPPGEAMAPALVYDSNARILADAVSEAGGIGVEMGIVADDVEKLRSCLHVALKENDVVLLSGGTSKGAGDLSYHVVAELTDPGIVAHGVALKPGKPICLAATHGKPVVVLPGFPTSAIFTFHEFIAPVLRRLAGHGDEVPITRKARLAVKINSDIGRTEFVLVGLIEADGRLVAFPMGSGSGSVTTFSRADGFVTIDRHEEIVEAGTMVDVRLMGRDLRLADLVVIGSHCVGLDLLMGKLHEGGFVTKFLAVGSTAGLAAARRGECDLAGVHLLDAETGEYNRPFLTPDLKLIAGYRRLQGIVCRDDDQRFAHDTPQEAIAEVKHDPACVMINRNQGSGTRILIDQLLDGAQPSGYAVAAKSHNAVAAAIVQGRADWGMAIETVARRSGLKFLPLTEEHYDFIVPEARFARPAVVAFRELLFDAEVQCELQRLGFGVSERDDKN